MNFSGNISSYTNGGTAGGTGGYINLGGIKIWWMSTSYSTAASSPTVVFPTSFFTATPVITASYVGASGTTAGQYIVTGTPSSTGFTYYTATNPVGAFFMAIGT